MPTRYFVSDVDRALAFYELLGFELVERWGPPFAIIQNGPVEVWLSGPGTSAMKPMADGRTPEPGGWNRIVVAVQDFEAVYQALKAAGTVFRNEPISGPGGTQVLAEDPDGNPIEIFQPRD